MPDDPSDPMTDAPWTEPEFEATLQRLWDLGLIEPTPPATGLGPDTVWRKTDLGRALDEVLGG
jgi:hypothetical protein